MEDARKKYLIQAEQLLMEEVPVIPLIKIKDIFAMKQSLLGHRNSRKGLIDFRSACWEKSEKPLDLIHKWHSKLQQESPIVNI